MRASPILSALREGEVRYTCGTLPTKYTNSWQPQAEMTYDGLGNRLAMTGYADGQSVSTQYVLDQGKVLLATANSQTTAYLYGLGVIGSQTDAWSYLLPDGLTSSRQLADASGQITQAASYTPWGDTWAVNGASLAYGYLGGMMDTATGLIYVGNGQYYDPSTGRFLTRDANPNQTNPYVPWKSDPTSLLISPLALLALVYTGKRKRSKLAIVVVLMVVCGVLGLGLAGCGPTTPGGGTPGIVTPPPAEQPGQSGTEYPSTPTPGGTPIGTPTYTCTPTPNFTNTPTPLSEVTIFFGGSDGASLANPGPDPKLQTPVWVQDATQVVPYPGGSKANQANQVDVNTYKDVNLIVIGYSAGGDSALMFADKYRTNQIQNNGTGKITDIAILGGTMSGIMTDGGDLAQEWPNVLSNLLIWGTDIYILDDKAAGGGEANVYQPPANAIGTFYFVQLEQEHWDGGLGGQLGIGTNNSETFKKEVISWFASN